MDHVSPDPGSLKPSLNGTQVARRFGVSRWTILRWANLGALHPAKTVGGHRRYRADEVEELARRLGAGQPAPDPAHGNGPHPQG